MWMRRVREHGLLWTEWPMMMVMREIVEVAAILVAARSPLWWNLLPVHQHGYWYLAWSQTESLGRKGTEVATLHPKFWLSTPLVRCYLKLVMSIRPNSLFKNDLGPWCFKYCFARIPRWLTLKTPNTQTTIPLLHIKSKCIAWSKK